MSGLCDATVFKRAATIAALNRAGFSLAVAGRIAYFLPFHTVLFEICDPGNVSPKGATDADTRRALPLRFRNPNASWFNPNQPAKADPKPIGWFRSMIDVSLGLSTARGETRRVWRFARRSYKICRVGPA